MLNDYSKIVSDSNCKTKYGEALKILTPKQMFQRLPTHVKVNKQNERNHIFFAFRKINH